MKKSTMEFMSVMTIVFALYVQIDAKTRTEFLSLLRAGKAEVADRLPPNYNYDEPSVVACYVDVNQVDTIRESNMDFTVDIGLHLSWKNKELGRTMDTGQFQFEYVDFDAQNMEKVWVPDIYFPNEKKAAIHNIMMANKMLRLYRNSTISYTIRVLLTLSCNMDLRKYPFDKQVCSILIESFGYTADKLVLVWDTNDNNPSPVMTENIELRQFRMVNIEYHNYTRTHSITGDHSCLQADFHLVRNIGYYVIQMYVPSLLIVMLSWLSFWLNVNSIPGRVTLGVLSVLTLSTQSSGVNASLPRVSYTKAIDVWMATCLVFAFAALIEFAVVNVLSQKVPGRRFSLATLFQVTKDGVDEKDTSVDQDGKVSIEGRNPPKSKVLLCSEYLDNASRFMFPLAFGIFNMIYWIYYLNVTEY